MGCLLGKLAAAPGSSLFFPAAAAAAGGGGGGDEVHLKATLPEHIAAVKKDLCEWSLWLSSAAGDALRGWAPRCADAFHNLPQDEFKQNIFLCLLVKKTAMDSFTVVANSQQCNMMEF